MSSPMFASLTAGLLARKGEAAPSKEPSFGHKPWQPPVAPVAVTQVDTLLPPPLPWTPPFDTVNAGGSKAEPQQQPAKVRLNDVAAAWPPAKAGHADAEDSSWVPARQQQSLQLASLGVPFKTTIRLTHAQARAVKLAALILDKPQQEILTAGLVERLEALACADLAKCSCFRAVLEGIKQPEPAPGEGEPPQS